MTDYIDRDALIKSFSPGQLQVDTLGEAYILNHMLVSIRAAPTADVAPVVRGMWIPSDDIDEYNVWDCSVCKKTFLITNDNTIHENGYNYCPACGADLREADDE